MGVASLLGLVPDGHAVVLQFEVALFLPGARLDFPHNRPNKHGPEVVIPLDAWNQEGGVFVDGVSISCLILSLVLIRPFQTWKWNFFFPIKLCPMWAHLVPKSPNTDALAWWPKASVFDWINNSIFLLNSHYKLASTNQMMLTVTQMSTDLLEKENAYIEREILPHSHHLPQRLTIRSPSSLTSASSVCVYIYIYTHTHIYIYKEVSHNPSTVYINKYKQTYGGCSLWKPFVVVSHFRHLDARTEREYSS